MAADGPVSAGDSQEIARRIKELNDKLDESLRANSSAKNTARIVAVLVAVAAIFGVYLIFSPFLDAYNDRERYQKIIMGDIQSEVFPAVEREVGKLMKESVPLLGEVARTTYAAREEEIMTKGYKEVETFLDNMTEYGLGEWDTRRNRIETVIVEKLKEAVPELRNEDEAELILANASLAINNAVERTMSEHLKIHIDSINNIGNQLGTFPVPQEIQDMDDYALREELTNSLGIYATLALRTVLNPESKEYLKTIVEEKPTGGQQ